MIQTAFPLSNNLENRLQIPRNLTSVFMVLLFLTMTDRYFSIRLIPENELHFNLWVRIVCGCWFSWSFASVVGLAKAKYSSKVESTLRILVALLVGVFVGIILTLADFGGIGPALGEFHFTEWISSMSFSFLQGIKQILLFNLAIVCLTGLLVWLINWSVWLYRKNTNPR